MQKGTFMTKFNTACKERVDVILLDIIQRRDEDPEIEAHAVGIDFESHSSSPPPALTLEDDGDDRGAC